MIVDHERHELRRVSLEVLQALVRGWLPEGVEQVVRFTPIGTSWVCLGAAGSVTVHAWPEYDLVTVDAYGVAARRLRASSELLHAAEMTLLCPNLRSAS